MHQSALIDKSSPVPAYHQVAEDIIDRINMGEWEASRKLPTEAALTKEYDVSRVTLRKALAYLEEQKFIETYQGKGIFIASPPKPFVEDLNFPSLYADKSSKRPNKPRIIKMHELNSPPSFVSNALQVKADHPLIFIQRIFIREDIVIGLNNVWMPYDLVPDILQKGLTNDSITQTLSTRYQYKISCIENYIEAININARDAKMLDAHYGDPALKIQSLHTLRDQRPIEFSITTWIGDLTRFHFIVNEVDPIKNTEEADSYEKDNS